MPKRQIFPTVSPCPRQTSAPRRPEMISSVDLPFRVMSTSPAESSEIADSKPSRSSQVWGAGHVGVCGLAANSVLGEPNAATLCAGTDRGVTKSPNDKGIVSRDDPLPNWVCSHAGKTQRSKSGHGETCSSLSATVIELRHLPRPSRYRRDVDSGCRGLSPRCRHWRSYFLCGGASRGDRLGGHNLILAIAFSVEWRNAYAPHRLHASYWNRTTGIYGSSWQTAA